MRLSEQWQAALAAGDEEELERVGRFLAFLELEGILTAEEVWAIREGRESYQAPTRKV